MKGPKEALNWGHVSKYRSEIMGFACLWVMLHHNVFDWPAFTYPLKRIAEFGNAGVDVFLFLSGVGLYYAWQKGPSLKHFYARRLVRILIPYLVIAGPYWIWRDLYLHQGSFFQDVTQLSLPLRHEIATWYIPAILLCYLCYPLICKGLEKRQVLHIPVSRHSMTILICTGIMLGCFVLRKVTPTFYDNSEIALTRLAVFVVGCDLGKTVFEKRPISQALTLGCAVTVFMYYVFRNTSALAEIWLRFSFIPLAVALCVTLAWLLLKLDGCAWLHRFLRFFGERSLELYLSHVLLRSVFYHYVPVDLWDPWGILTYGVILFAAIVLSTVLHPVFGKLYSRLLNT